MARNIYKRIKGWSATYQRLKKLSVNDPTIIKKVLRAKMISGKRIFLLGTPIHSNLGDHLIALSEIYFFSRYFADYELIDCIMPLAKYNIDILERSVRKKDILCVSGGGWLGTKWKDDEEFVRRILNIFYNNPIIILPQTVFYEREDQFFEKGKEIYSSHKKLLFCLREKASYEYVIRNGFVSEEKAFLMPDFALLYREYGSHPSRIRDGIGLCFRNDNEKTLSPETLHDIVRITNSISSSQMVSTLSKLEFIKTDQREDLVMAKLEEISKYRLLITDRLHAMIMAALTNTPCAALDNATHKVCGVYNWIRDLDYIILMNENTHYYQQIVQLYNCNMLTSFNSLNFTDYELELHDKINTFIEENN